jgi:hypothetical protein
MFLGIENTKMKNSDITKTLNVGTTVKWIGIKCGILSDGEILCLAWEHM